MKFFYSLFALFLIMTLVDKVYSQCPTSLSLASTDISTATCPSNGSFRINATVGTGISYQITAGPSGFPPGAQNVPTFTSLLPGNYTVRVSCLDDPTIFTTTSFTIPSSYVQVAASSITSNICNANTNGGTITTTATGSASPFTYAYWQGDPGIADGTLTYGSDNFYNATAFGTYNVRTKDACGVFVTHEITIANPYPDNLCISGIFLNFGDLTCTELETQIWARFYVGSATFESLPAGGMDIDVYENLGDCANRIQGTLLSTQHYDNMSTNNNILVPNGQNLLFVLRTPCGETCTYCFDYDPDLTKFNQSSTMNSKGCVTPGNPITYSIDIDVAGYYVFPITWEIRNSLGTIVGTYVANSEADLPHNFDNLPEDTYTSTAIDGCGNDETEILTPPSGTPNELNVMNVASYIGCSSIEGRTTLSIYVQGVMANLVNATATVIAPSPTQVGTTIIGYYGLFRIENAIPGGTYYLQIDNGCGQTDIISAVVPTTVEDILIQYTNVNVEQLCGGTGNIIVEAAYNGNGNFNFQIRNSANMLVGIGTVPGGTYSNLPAGVYTITSNIGACGPYSYNSQVTILPGGSGPVITKKLGLICEDGTGNPTGTGTALLSFVGAEEMRVDYRLSSGTDIDYINITNDSDGSETITGLLPYTDYTVRVTDVCGNSIVTEIAIGELDVVRVENELQPCINAPYTISVPDMVDATYSWTKDGTFISSDRIITIPNYTAGDNGTYVCTITIASGCVTRVVSATLNSTQCGNPLPIDLVNFSGSSFESGINLTWKTANETNFSHFEILKSINAKEFGTIGTVTGDNKTFYNYTDTQPNEGRNYYQLKMVDLDGKITISKIIAINFEKGSSYISAQNPAVNGEFKVLSNLKNPKFSIVNNLGRSIPANVVQTGNNSFQINVLNPISGTYYLGIDSLGKNQTLKIIIP